MLTIEMDNFDLGQICRSGQCFRMDQIGDDRYRVIAGDKYLELTQERGIVNFFCPEEDFIFFWIRYFDLDCDYSEYINMINPRDKYLTAAGEMGSGIRILQQDLWEMIISFLISQQNNITRIKKCIENISREFGVRKQAAQVQNIMRFRLQRHWLWQRKNSFGSVIWDTEQNMCWTQPEKSVSEIFHLTVCMI